MRYVIYIPDELHTVPAVNLLRMHGNKACTVYMVNVVLLQFYRIHMQVKV